LRFRLQVLLFAALTAGASARAADTLWTSPRGTPGGRAVCRWNSKQPPPEIRQWHYESKHNRRYKMGLAVWSSPAIALVGGRPTVFIGGYDQTMHALDLAGKEVLWRKITNGEIAGPPAVGLIAGRQVVFWGSADRHVYAYYANSRGDYDGRRAWPARELLPPTNTQSDATLSAPLLLGGKLYITCFVYDKAFSRSQQKGWLFCLDQATGKALWQREVSQGPVGHPAGRLIKGKATVFVCARKGLLQAYDVSGATPRQLWTYQMPHEVMGSPVVEETGEAPLLFLGSKFGNLHAIEATTGAAVWKRMSGNWIDNTACIGKVAGERHVFVGSHDYSVYAYSAASGELRWKRHLGGEVYSAPSFFHYRGKPLVAVAALDNHLYVLDADTGKVFTSYYTGTPVWDKVAKGETLWGSSAIFEAGEETAIVHGSFNDFVYVYPVSSEKPCELRTKVQSPSKLWWGLLITLVVFAGAVLPIILRIPERKPQSPHASS
jgi:outer membrane protein assembly factor BamB